VYRRNDVDAAALGQYAGHVQDLAAGALNWEIAHGARIDAGRALHDPAQRCVDFERKAGPVCNSSCPVFNIDLSLLMKKTLGFIGFAKKGGPITVDQEVGGSNPPSCTSYPPSCTSYIVLR